MIELEHLTKTFGGTTAVDDLTVTIKPGMVTGFLGPNGAGKSTTMRMIVGLDRPTQGEVTVAGRRYADHPAPLRSVGALLDARAVHPRRSAYSHVLALALTHGIPRRRVDDVLALVGLTEVAHRRAGAYSLGMLQRLGVATAMLGDPQVLLFDEPVNGLDPEGIRWVRELMRTLASDGRTVLVSSHLMSEMAMTADHLVVVGRGRLLADLSMAEMTESIAPSVRVGTPRARELAEALSGAGAQVDAAEPQVLSVTGLGTTEIADLAAARAIPVHELTPVHASLEDAYLRMTHDSTEFRAGAESGRAAA